MNQKNKEATKEAEETQDEPKAEEPQVKTLELIASSLAPKLAGKGLKGRQISRKIRERVYEAGLFATIYAVADVLGPKAVATPLYRIGYDEDNNNVEITFLKGQGSPPENGKTDIEYLDFGIASFACENINLLAEGLAGIGKTFNISYLMKAILPPSNRKELRLDPNMSNVLQPYTYSRIEGGSVCKYINMSAVRSVLSLLIDESNRGAAQALLGLLDGKVSLATGETAEIGHPIPQIKVSNDGKDIKIDYDDERLKHLVVFLAQNPHNANYVATRALDEAVRNRMLRIDFPNGAANSGSATANMGGGTNHIHERFMKSFVPRLAEYLPEVDAKELESLLLPQSKENGEKKRAESEYLSVYSYTLDPANSRNKFLMSALDCEDQIIVLAGPEGLAKRFEIELDVAKRWTENLASYGVNFIYNESIDPGSQLISRIDAVRESLSEKLNERDKNMGDRIADAIALISRYKEANAKTLEEGGSPVEKFRALQKPLTLKEIAAAYAIVIEDKMQEKGKVSCETLINQAFKDYIDVLNDFAPKLKNKMPKFTLDDPNQSIRYISSYLALESVAGMKGAAPDEYASKMIEAINKAAYVLRGLDVGTSDTKKLLVARINADLASFAGFVDRYRGRIAETLNNVSSTKPIDNIAAMQDLIKEARKLPKTDYTQQRTERVFGV